MTVATLGDIDDQLIDGKASVFDGVISLFGAR
jgi:hypothetical protein